MFLAYFSQLACNIYFVYISIAFAGARIAFLVYNFSHGKIFLNESGSMLLGYALSITNISVFQRADFMSL